MVRSRQISDHLVSPAWLAEHLFQPETVILYTDMRDPFTGKAEPMPQGVIPGSRYFDFESKICNPDTGLPHSMPSAAWFQTCVRELGVNQTSRVVVYDSRGIYCSARIWWMFKVMGHSQVSVLDGGLPAWLTSGYEVSNSLTQATAHGDFISRYHAELLQSAEQLLANLNNDKVQIIDARSADRFYARVPEPRKGLRSGHIPGSTNIPFTECLNNGYLNDVNALNALFNRATASTAEQLVFSCGSGVTACVLALAAAKAGYQQLAVYDGSWSEWGGREDLPLEVD